MMSEDVTPAGEGGKDLPGGFESPDAMYAQLQTYKEDLAKHKTRASELTSIQEERDALAAKLAEIDNAQKTELQLALDRVSELETTNADALRKVEEVQRNSLLTMEIAKRVAGKPEALAGIYETVAKAKCGGFKDEENLAELLDSVDEELKGVAFGPNEDGQQVTITRTTPPGGKPQAVSEEIQRFNNLSAKDQIREARKRAK